MEIDTPWTLREESNKMQKKQKKEILTRNVGNEDNRSDEYNMINKESVEDQPYQLRFVLQRYRHCRCETN